MTDSNVTSLAFARAKKAGQIDAVLERGRGGNYITRNRTTGLMIRPLKTEDRAHSLEVYTRCPSKYLLIDQETAKVYRGQVPASDSNKRKNSSWAPATDPIDYLEARHVLLLNMMGQSTTASIHRPIPASEIFDGNYVLVMMTNANGAARPEPYKIIELDTTSAFERGWDKPVITICSEYGQLAVLILNSEGGVDAGNSVGQFDLTTDYINSCDPSFWLAD